MPSPKLRWLISAVVVFHLAALAISYAAIVEPSATHSELLNALTPYLRSTHFAAEGRRFYLAHATPDEQPHRLQYATRNEFASFEVDPRTQWTTVQPEGYAGLASHDHYARWMTLIATLAESEQPSLAAALLLPLVEENDEIDAVRIVRLPTQLTTIAEDSRGPVFLARVIRSGENVKLVSIKAKRLTTYQRADDSAVGAP